MATRIHPVGTVTNVPALCIVPTVVPTRAYLGASLRPGPTDMANVQTTFDILEVLPDGSLLWKGAVPGLAEALKEAEALAKSSPNELKVVHVPTQTVLGTLPAKGRPSGSAT